MSLEAQCLYFGLEFGHHSVKQTSQVQMKSFCHVSPRIGHVTCACNPIEIPGHEIKHHCLPCI